MDVSNYGVGALLSQTDAEGPDHLVAFFSWKFLDKEQKYSMIEKESLPIKLAISAFLLGHPFVMQRDHQTLQWLSNITDEIAIW